MNPRSRISVLVLGASLSAMGLDLSGTVINPDGTPRSGVSVVLASGGSTATTNAAGQWSLGSVGIAERAHRQVVASHLSVADGRLRLAWEGRDLSGRISGQGGASARQGMSAIAARSVSPPPDTIVYSLGGRVFLRDTASVSRTGIFGTYDTTWSTKFLYGWLADSRDGRLYRTVKIGSQTWMAENLNYAGAGVCYNGSTDSCSKYGRWYTWLEVMAGSSSSRANPSGVKGICPEGWHVPSDAEWKALEVAVGMTTDEAALRGARGTTEGTKLKSSSGWDDCSWCDSANGNGTDAYGFRVLPAGNIWDAASNSSGGGAGINAHFWSAFELDASDAWDRSFDRSTNLVDRYDDDKGWGFSLRCRQD